MFDRWIVWKSEVNFFFNLTLPIWICMLAWVSSLLIGVPCSWLLAIGIYQFVLHKDQSTVCQYIGWFNFPWLTNAVYFICWRFFFLFLITSLIVLSLTIVFFQSISWFCISSQWTWYVCWPFFSVKLHQFVIQAWSIRLYVCLAHWDCRCAWSLLFG